MGISAGLTGLFEGIAEGRDAKRKRERQAKLDAQTANQSALKQAIDLMTAGGRVLGPGESPDDATMGARLHNANANLGGASPSSVEGMTRQQPDNAYGDVQTTTLPSGQRILLNPQQGKDARTEQRLFDIEKLHQSGAMDAEARKEKAQRMIESMKPVPRGAAGRQNDGT